MSDPTIVVTGGGTSGHVLPAIAIMDRLVLAGHDRAALHYVGTTRGIEQRLLPPTGYAHTFLDVVGLQRSLSRRNLSVLPKLLRARRLARRLLHDLDAAVVVNVGGYASMPATLAARRAKVPVVVVSYDLLPGLSSRIAARFATAVACAFPGSSLHRGVTTGAPIRPEIISVDRGPAGRAAARELLGLPADRFVVSVVGGSLGAKAINDAVAELVCLAADRSDLAVHHVVGERWREAVAAATGERAGVHAEAGGTGGIMYRVIGYEDRMPAVYAASDLLVTRAGASTIAELAATGSPAIVVPWPDAAENHQVANARTLSDTGGAVLLEQHLLTGARLLADVDRLAADRAALAAMGAAAHAEGVRHRGDSLIDLVRDVAAGRRPERGGAR